MSDSREAFENFAQDRLAGLQRKGHGYESKLTQILWETWQAAWGCQQAHIDLVMLEECPDEMTASQKEEWRQAQVASVPRIF